VTVAKFLFADENMAVLLLKLLINKHEQKKGGIDTLTSVELIQVK